MYYSYENFVKDLAILKAQIEAKIGKPDALIAIARGGLTMAHFLAISWELSNLFTINANSYNQDNERGSLRLFNIPKIPTKDEKILIVDEIVDSGVSLMTIDKYFKQSYPTKHFYTAAIFQKSQAVFKADFSLHENDQWVDFFWETWHKK